MQRGRAFITRLARAICVVVVVLGLHANATPVLVPLPTSDRVSVLYEPGLESIADQIGASANAALERIAADLADLPTPKTIQLHVVREARDLAKIAPSGRTVPPVGGGYRLP